MKKVATLGLLLFVIISSFAQTADEVVNKFIEASGGKEKLMNIKTVQYNQLMKLRLPMGNFDVPLKFYKEKDKLFRLQASMSFGAQSISFFTLVSDTAGYVMVPNNTMMGTTGGLKKMPESDRSAQAFQLETEGFFANLVDYAIKGHKVELLKDEKVNKEECYSVKQTLKNGQELIYFINKNTNLITKMDTKGEVAASISGMGAMMSGMGASANVKKLQISSFYTNYNEIDGVKFPTKITISGPMGITESEISNIMVNKPINVDLYKAS